MNFIKRVFRFGIRKLDNLFCWTLDQFPVFKCVRETQRTQVPISYKQVWKQRVLGAGKSPYWPVHPASKINQFKNICIGVETSPGYEPGCYIQGIGKVYIGDYTQIAQNVGIISSNHDLYDNSIHHHEEVHIGRYCWLGMNSVVLPGVRLGDFTVVGAGAVVTKSFPEGYCVIAGNPAKIIKTLEKDKCVEYKSDREYVGFIPKNEFESFRSKNLWI
ncbi:MULTISPECIES: DapH/DapD/GlmU-related protein [unclassified Paraflavitalea]|uniref:DapH/DapD/GlmU-related protein n=1 Tax=unclassified Paraflavitalea TaxID=2798305 RepID=UPI003D32B6EE